jgi:hypothetical protein
MVNGGVWEGMVYSSGILMGSGLFEQVIPEMECMGGEGSSFKVLVLSKDKNCDIHSILCTVRFRLGLLDLRTISRLCS